MRMTIAALQHCVISCASVCRMVLLQLFCFHIERVPQRLSRICETQETQETRRRPWGSAERGKSHCTPTDRPCFLPSCCGSISLPMPNWQPSISSFSPSYPFPSFLWYPPRDLSAPPCPVVQFSPSSLHIFLMLVLLPGQSPTNF